MSPAISRPAFALRLILTNAAVLLLVVGVTSVLTWYFPPTTRADSRFPAAFAASTVALWLGSWSLSRSVHFVRRERQQEFRRHLRWSLLFGCLFIAIQGWALQWLFSTQDPSQVQTGDRAFVGVAAAIHVLHVFVALFFLTFVLLQAHADRYDHEYFWGVSACAWFWHGLGLIWLVVLTIIAISGLPEEGLLPARDPGWRQSTLDLDTRWTVNPPNSCPTFGRFQGLRGFDLSTDFEWVSRKAETATNATIEQFGWDTYFNHPAIVAEQSSKSASLRTTRAATAYLAWS